MTRLTDSLKAIGALLALVAIVVGTPIALAIAVGWPLPTTIPTAASIREALGAGGIDSTVIVKLVALVIWLAWLHVLAAFALEVVSIARRRPTVSLPGMASVQITVARLMATAALFGSVIGATRAPDPVALPRLHLIAQPNATPEVPPTAPTAPAKPRPTYVVARHDSLWSIAEHRLGDGFRWREIRDLNAGRTMPGGARFDGSSDVVQAGWVLELPADASTSPDGASSTVTVETGDSLWSIANDTAAAAVGHAPTAAERDAHWRAVVDANRSHLVDPDNPSLIYAGQEITIPDLPTTLVTADVPATSAPSTPPAEPVDEPVPLATTDTTTVVHAAPAPTEDERAPSTGRLGVAAAALAVGVTTELSRRRRRRIASASDAVPAPVPSELHDIAVAAAIDADLDLIERRDGALRALAQLLAPADLAVRPRLVQTSATRVEVLLSRPLAPATAPWRAEGGGQVWSTEEDLRVTQGCDPAPSLVTVGAVEDGRQLWFDLEAAGVVSVLGDQARDTVRSMIRELSGASAAPELVVVDDPTSDLLTESACCATWAELADDLLARARQTRDYLQANRWTSAHDVRAHSGPDDATAPVVVVVASVPDDERFDELCDIVTGGLTAISVIVLSPVLVGTVFVVDGDRLSIPSLDLTCRAQALPADAAAEIDELLTHARHGQLVMVEDATPDAPAAVDLRSVKAERPAITVRLLGEIDVVGGRRLLTPKQVAVLAYIVLHAPVPSERVEDAVWPNGTMASRKRLANTVSECRSAIGAVHLPVATDGRYTVGTGVGTDLQDFDHHMALARYAEPADKVDHLRAALELVRGPVFTYRSNDRDSYIWIDLENWLSSWELKVINAALELSEFALDLDDAETAVWAAEQGLRVSSLHSTLIEALMRALWRRGDSEAAERVYQSHAAALEDIDGDSVADSTIDLRDEIRAQSA